MILWLTEITGVFGGAILERATLAVFDQELIIKEKNRSLAEEKESSESLLLNVLPSPIAQRLKLERSSLPISSAT